MKNITLAIFVLLSVQVLFARTVQEDNVITSNVSIEKSGKNIVLTADLVLDSLELGSTKQIFVTPIVYGEKGETAVFPSVLLTGRSMHYAFLRGTMPNLKEYKSRYDILKEVRRYNNKPQSVGYKGSVSMQPWMRVGNLSVQFLFDNCGCGIFTDSESQVVVDTTLNPVSSMRMAYVTPKVSELPVTFHEGSARVQFEVNKTELHDKLYRCRNGQVIDNREQLKVIYDSIEYALSDPNVDITKIEIIGYASPESPYNHNKDLATGRSHALAEFIGQYVGKKYNIPSDVAVFDAVPENWSEFRDLVEVSDEITDTQRVDLLALIDAPAFSPSDLDAKEKELKTNPKFRELYLKKILPEWFPRLRATKFRIGTRLKPLSDEKLAEVMKSTPEKMSLNQMMRVAKLYPEGSEEFNKAINTALRFYPDDEVANLNAAVTAINNQEYELAKQLLKKAGNIPEAINARAVLMTNEGNFEEASDLFKDIQLLPEAQRNYQLLRE